MKFNPSQAAIAAILLLVASGSPLAASVHSTDKYAWSETAGWFNHNDPGAPARVFADHLEGFAWAEGIGWVKLGSFTGGGAHTYANVAGNSTDWGVNRGSDGRLSGYAWSETAGWINFGPNSGGGVTIDPATGRFSGYAWSESLGYVKFAGANPAYRVALATRTVVVQSAGGGAVGGGGSYPPFATVTLTNTPSSGYTLAGWSPAPCASSFTMPDANLTCTASFDYSSCGVGPETVTTSFPSGNYRVRSGTTLEARSPETSAATPVTVGGATTQAAVEFEATQSLRLGPIFKVTSGSTFHARIADVVCPAGRGGTESAGEKAQRRAARTSTVSATPPPAARLLARDEIPAGLARLLEGIGADGFAADASGNRIVFATRASLVAADRNGRSDVYLYEADAERLTALSLAATGWTANGNSLEPRIDGSGRFVTFSSDAPDLAADDLNGLSDIFVLDLEANLLERVSQSVENGPSRRPDLSANGAAVVFEQAGEGGSTVVLFDGSSGEVTAVEDGLGSVERHHPAISADGRFLAYLAGDGDSCAIRFADRESGLLGQADCPAGLAEREDAVPLFDDGAGWLLWKVPGAGVLEAANPLRIDETIK